MNLSGNSKLFTLNNTKREWNCKKCEIKQLARDTKQRTESSRKQKKKRRENCDGRHSISKWHQQQENNNTKKNCSTSTKEQKTSSIYATHCQCAFIGTMAIRWFVQRRKKKFRKNAFRWKNPRKIIFRYFSCVLWVLFSKWIFRIEQREIFFSCFSFRFRLRKCMSTCNNVFCCNCYYC